MLTSTYNACIPLLRQLIVPMTLNGSGMALTVAPGALRLLSWDGAPTAVAASYAANWLLVRVQAFYNCTDDACFIGHFTGSNWPMA